MIEKNLTKSMILLKNLKRNLQEGKTLQKFMILMLQFTYGQENLF